MNHTHWEFAAHDSFDLENFLASLNPNQEASVVLFLLEVQKFPRLSDAPRSWIRPLGAGLFEFRIRDENVLIRIFFSYKQGRIVLLLGGYDKGADSSSKRQQREISLARKRLTSA